MNAFAQAALAVALATVACVASATQGAAIVTRDQTALRAAPRDSSQQQAVLWQGEVVEVRGARMDYLQVYDYRRERGGFVRAAQVHRITGAPSEAADLRTLLRFLRETPGNEALSIGLAMAFIQAASGETLRGEAGSEVLDALGTAADRLAARASSGAAGETRLAAHLDVAARYGVRFASFERGGRMQICYEGDAFRRVLAMASAPEQRARAALALTRPECVDPDRGPTELARHDEWRAEVLDRVDAAALEGYVLNRVAIRRASVWAGIAHQRARAGSPPEPAARRALEAFAAVRTADLPEADLADYNEAAMRVAAVRWALAPVSGTKPSTRLHLAAAAGQPGETCVELKDARTGNAKPLARRCTYGIVWTASVTANREGSALAVAVQPVDGWVELWVFRKSADGWSVRVLPPAPATPGIGYVEAAGWVPGGAELLVAREARAEGRYRRSFEVVQLDSLAVARQAGDAELLGAFRRWQEPAWKAATLSLR